MSEFIKKTLSDNPKQKNHLPKYVTNNRFRSGIVSILAITFLWWCSVLPKEWIDAKKAWNNILKMTKDFTIGVIWIWWHALELTQIPWVKDIWTVLKKPAFHPENAVVSNEIENWNWNSIQ